VSEIRPSSNCSELSIERIEAWYCAVPLEQPLRLGGITVASRDFVVLRVRCRSGLDGLAYALTRGAPIDRIVTDLVAPHLIGEDAQDPDRALAKISRALPMLEPVGLLQRAVSLIDICLWDIRGKRHGVPVWKLLGGARSEAPVMLVAPYAGPDDSDVQYAERIASLTRRGYHAIKLYPLPDPSRTAERLDAIREAVGGVRLVVDAAWSWRASQDALQALRQWEKHELAWIEDPLPAADWREMQVLASELRTPVAAGDEVSVPSTMETLVRKRAVDVLRLDATTIGGLSAFRRLRDLAWRAGYLVSPHAYPEIHRHAVFGWPGVEPLEIFPAASPTWGTHRFLGPVIDLEPGTSTIPAPAGPGLGLEVDWAAVQALAVRSSIVSA
jgi:L-alanine-DL-glutamate epimerase-like enolase superfamily enzyme